VRTGQGELANRRRRLLTSDLDLFEKSANGDSLKHLIELAKRLLPWQVKEALEDAQKVRESARRAVHFACPNPR
jgi:hypothetical protein